MEKHVLGDTREKFATCGWCVSPREKSAIHSRDDVLSQLHRDVLPFSFSTSRCPQAI